MKLTCNECKKTVSPVCCDLPMRPDTRIIRDRILKAADYSDALAKKTGTLIMFDFLNVSTELRAIVSEMITHERCL